MGRDPTLERAWRDRVARQQESGLTIQQFCEREKVPAHQFSFWKRELRLRDALMDRGKRTKRRKRRKQKPVTAGFVPVRITPGSQHSATIEIVLDQPLRIAVASGFDHDLLVEVVRLLENRQC